MKYKKIVLHLHFSLRGEEQTRQKLHIERTQLEGKIKNYEDVIASLQNELAKVKFIHDKKIYHHFFLFIV